MADGSDRSADKEARYAEVVAGIQAVLQGESDWVAAMATVSCQLHEAFDHYHWTGFYRHVGDEMLVVGPYQGHLGCLRIPFNRGVCGAAARTKQAQLVPDVRCFPGYIACASSTKSEIVVPVVQQSSGRVLAVLDVDSDDLAAFDQVDRRHLQRLCEYLGGRGWQTGVP